ncbi:hypothetical protein [Chelativorans xinjiangense]|uniref:hypothetical protein n=1 Tax=Chelativorans xinjiangense TaxID=2681485 RepID=UPI0013592972|nr:hypothetical protein [Chelativorans xinjiangense]
MANRYDKRLEDEDLWEVYEVRTGRVVLIAGQPYDGMAEHEADEIVQLLETGAVTPDDEWSVLLPPQRRQADPFPLPIKRRADLPDNAATTRRARRKG